MTRWDHTGAWLFAIATLAVAAPAREASDAKAKDTEKEKEEERLPLEPSRKIEFETDEGTRGSLDVSPDGQTIFFELLGDLYTLPIEGGAAKAVTKGLALHRQPRLSPD